MIVVVDDLAHILLLEGVADIVLDEVDGLNNLDVTEILPNIRGERMERIASPGNLHAVAILLVEEAKLSVVDVAIDILIGIAVHNLRQLVIGGGTVQGQPGQNAANPGRILCGRVLEVLWHRYLALVAIRCKQGIRILGIHHTDIAGREVHDAIMVCCHVGHDSLEGLALVVALCLHPAGKVFLVLGIAGRIADVVPLDGGDFLQDIRLGKLCLSDGPVRSSTRNRASASSIQRVKVSSAPGNRCLSCTCFRSGRPDGHTVKGQRIDKHPQRRPKQGLLDEIHIAVGKPRGRDIRGISNAIIITGVGRLVLQNHHQDAPGTSGNGCGRLRAEVYDDLWQAENFFFIRHLPSPPSVQVSDFPQTDPQPVSPCAEAFPQAGSLRNPNQIRNAGRRQRSCSVSPVP